LLLALKVCRSALGGSGGGSGGSGGGGGGGGGGGSDSRIGRGHLMVLLLPCKKMTFHSKTFGEDESLPKATGF